MTLTELRYIVTLAQEQHFGRAADRCHVSQPTLSIAVKKLEQELEVELFERSKNSVRTTPTGEKVVAQAQRVLEQTSAISDIASAGRDQLNTPLHVGAIFTIGPYLYPHFIPKLQELSPQMPLVVEEGYTASLRKRLRNGELDVIIVALPFTEPDVVTQPLYTESFVTLLPSNHPLTKKKSVSPADLDGENVLLMGEGHCFRDQVLEAMPNINQQQEDTGIRTHTEGSSLETLRHMVATGLGVSILPMSAALGSSSYEGTLVTRPFSGVKPSRTAALAWRASFPRHKAIDALRNAIQKSPLRNIEMA
ncbi:LysR substrate-binding domain-containing protein [Porticoccus sp. W117]|uniref:hydrogen peroxide-inducible genes activator n=1 Tax=Porticoccus sp. W117 TaxID=3054777 RepID=UPI002598D78B|nr:hydrogen peroxide-inducible genes activator [Porticoccus sp. W117]MDM3870524.1 LysR substrate-binding domain-containing protein [Porticoccus sp. W117]